MPPLTGLDGEADAGAINIALLRSASSSNGLSDERGRMDRQNPSQASDTALREEPRVSVVVPSYNHAPFVGAALCSVFAQTRAPARLLVIDDGLRDGSPHVIEGVLKDCPFPCELIARENRGLCATLNEGLAKTSGRYFAYLGSDDLWLPGFLDARVAQLEAR